jgi:ABC-type bacteriocin/lantibiotic exporter with double-glycine peptidase domain
MRVSCRDDWHARARPAAGCQHSLDAALWRSQIVVHLKYLRSLFGYAFRHNRLLYASFGLTVISVFLELAAMGVLMPLASITAGDHPSGSAFAVRFLDNLGARPDGRSLLLLFVALFAARVLTQFLSQGLIIYTGRRLLLQLTSQAFSALVRSVPIKELEERSIGYFISLAGDEANRASNLILITGQFVSALLLGGLYFLAIVSYSRSAALAVAIFLLVSFLLLVNAFRVSHRLGIRQIEQSQSANSIFLDALNSLRSVRSFSAENYVANSYYSQIRSYMRTLALIDIISLSARLGPALLLFAAAAGVALLPAITGRFSLDLPFVVTIVILLLRFFPIAGQTLNLSLRIIADSRAGRDVTRIISDHPASPRSNSAREMAATIDRIEAKHIDFSHLDGKPVLKDFNVAICRGRSYAIVGRSGSGKSTFLDLLLGFYAPDKGNISINGIDGAELNKSEIRRRILLVSQDAAIFNDTVANNLKLGMDATQDELERACMIACIHDFILTLPNGYQTVLQYRGSNFSGGQKQRIGIARAMLRRPEVLLLDEGTSALDSATREQVVLNLQTALRDRILVFVTHDAFVAGKVDQVFDMDAIDSVEMPDPVFSRGDAA